MSIKVTFRVKNGLNEVIFEENESRITLIFEEYSDAYNCFFPCAFADDIIAIDEEAEENED